MDIKTRVQALLRIKGMTQKELAEKLGITQVGLSQTLSSKYPSTRTIEKIANAIGVEIEDIFTNGRHFSIQDNQQNFTALIADGEKLYKCSSVNELQELIYELKRLSQEQ